MYGANKKTRAARPENKYGTARMQEQAKEERNKRLREQTLADFKAKNQTTPKGAPKGTTSGKDAAGREVYYAPGSAPRYSVKSKSYSVGQAEGPSFINEKDMKKRGKLARLEKKFDKLSSKREIAKSNPQKRNKITRIAKKENRLMAKHTKIVNK